MITEHSCSIEVVLIISCLQRLNPKKWIANGGISVTTEAVGLSWLAEITLSMQLSLSQVKPRSRHPSPAGLCSPLDCADLCHLIPLPCPPLSQDKSTRSVNTFWWKRNKLVFWLDKVGLSRGRGAGAVGSMWNKRRRVKTRPLLCLGTKIECPGKMGPGPFQRQLRQPGLAGGQTSPSCDWAAQAPSHQPPPPLPLANNGVGVK